MAGDFPEELHYTESDEWIRREGDDWVTGVTSFAAEQLGDVVYVAVPEKGKHYNKGDAYGEIESVKAVSDLYTPTSGEIVDANGDLDANPSLVNDDPYGRGWIMKIHPDDPHDYDQLLDADAYRQHTEEQH